MKRTWFGPGVMQMAQGAPLPLVPPRSLFGMLPIHGWML